LTTAQCGTKISIPITGKLPQKGWLRSDGTANQDIGLAARVISVGVGGIYGVPSGQWNFLSVSATTAGLTGQIIPKGFFSSSCGKSVDNTDGTTMIPIVIDEPSAPTAQPTYYNGRAIPGIGATYKPDPRNHFHATFNPSPLWYNTPFLPAFDPTDATADVTLGTVELDTGIAQFQVCASQLDLRIVVANCPVIKLADDYVEALTAPPTVVNTNTDYRGGFLTWRQVVPTNAATVASKFVTEALEVDVVSSWAKDTTFTKEFLQSLQIEVFTIPAAGSIATTMYSNTVYDYMTPPPTTPGTLWGKLAEIKPGETPNRSTEFRVDQFVSYDTYIMTFRIEFDRKSTAAMARSYRVVFSGCCRPTSLFTISGTTLDVFASNDSPYSIDATVTLEPPQSADFPRSSPEVFVPPVVWMAGSAASAAAYDKTAFGGFVAGSGTSGKHVFTTSDISGVVSLLTPSGENTITKDYVLLQAKFLRSSSFSASLYVTPPPLTGTTVRSQLVQYAADGTTIVSSTTYDFIVLRRQLENDAAVDETLLCNLPSGANDFKAYQQGSTSTVAFTAVGNTNLPAIEYKFQFTQDRQCGNQVGVRLLEQPTATTYDKVFQKPADCGGNCALVSDTTDPTRKGDGTAYNALWFLYSDVSSQIAPVYHDSPAAPFQRRALFGLAVLAAGSTGQAKLTTPVSPLYPLGYKFFTRARMGVQYCYNRAYVQCTTGYANAGAKVTVVASNCIAPASQMTTLCANNYGSISFSTDTTHGTGKFSFLIAEVTSASVWSNLILTTLAQSASSTIALPAPVTSSSTYTALLMDTVNCPFSATLKPYLVSTADTTVPLTLAGITTFTNPTCDTAGTAQGVGATVSFQYKHATATNLAIKYSYESTTGVTFASGHATTNADATATFNAATNTYTFTTNLDVLSATTAGTPVLSFTVTGIAVQYSTNNPASATATGAPTFKVNFPTVVPVDPTGPLTASIQLGVSSTTPSASVVVSGGRAPYTYQWSILGGGVTFPGSTTSATVDLPSMGLGGKTLQVVVTDANTPNGCKVTATLLLPNTALTARIDFSIGATVPTIATTQYAAMDFYDSQFQFTINTLTASVPTGTNGYLFVTLSRCTSFTAFPPADSGTGCTSWSQPMNILCSPYTDIFAPGTQTVSSTDNWVSLQLTAYFVPTTATTTTLTPVVRYINYRYTAQFYSPFPPNEPDGSCVYFFPPTGALGKIVNF
jgi:hypothetical protein